MKKKIPMIQLTIGNFELVRAEDVIGDLRWVLEENDFNKVCHLYTAPTFIKLIGVTMRDWRKFNLREEIY